MEPSDFQLNKSSAQVPETDLLPSRVMENHKINLIIRYHNLKKKKAKCKNKANTIKKKKIMIITMTLSRIISTTPTGKYAA